MRVLRGVGGYLLPCGCLVGRYETYRGEVIEVIDAAASDCREPSHRTGDQIAPAAHPFTDSRSS
jgi:hypothetical protein